jgi:hypothetical protein
LLGIPETPDRWTPAAADGLRLLTGAQQTGELDIAATTRGQLEPVFWRCDPNRYDRAYRGLRLGLVLSLLLLLLMPCLGLAAEARAFLSQSQVYEGDRVLLTVEVAGRSLGQEPDLTRVGFGLRGRWRQHLAANAVCQRAALR